MAGSTAGLARVTAPGDWLLGSPRVRRLLALQTGILLASGVGGAVALQRSPSLAREPLALVSALPQVSQAEALAAERPSPASSPPSTTVVVSRSNPRPRPTPRPTTTVKARRPTAVNARPVSHTWDYWSPRIRRCESSGNYRARNPETGASGAYQILDSTWGGRFGVTHAGDASPAQQDEVAEQLYRTFGLRPWAESAPCWR